MRENQDFATAKSVMTDQAFNKANSAKNQMFRYLDIDVLRKCISTFLYGHDNISYMYDYIFLCFMMGNDFIPNLSFLKVKRGALDILCDIYKKVYDKLQENLVVQEEDQFMINFQFLSRVIEMLARIEDDRMKEVVGYHTSVHGVDMNRNKRFPSRIDKFMHELEISPVMGAYEPNIDAIDPCKDGKWRLSYYHHLFGTISTTMMKQCSVKYLEGLLWTTNYYFNLKVDNHWCYPYEYSPCISDLYKYTCMMESCKFTSLQKQLQHSPSKPDIDTNLQMLMVLPPQSVRFIPKHLQTLYTDISLGCVHYFPSKFKLSSFMKTHLWECSPVLPFIEFDRIESAITKQKVENT